MRFFEFKDRNGRIIYLTKERWEHINKEHPEVINYFKDLPFLSFVEILNKPTKIVDYPYDSKIKYYYKYFKERKEKAKYLLMIVCRINRYVTTLHILIFNIYFVVYL